MSLKPIKVSLATTSGEKIEIIDEKLGANTHPKTLIRDFQTHLAKPHI